MDIERTRITFPLSSCQPLLVNFLHKACSLTIWIFRKSTFDWFTIMVITKNPSCKPAQDPESQQWGIRMIFERNQRHQGCFSRPHTTRSTPSQLRSIPASQQCLLPMTVQSTFQLSFSCLNISGGKKMSKKPKYSLPLKYRLNHSRL